MTEIRWAETADICYIRAEGHAGYNPGNDIVCAAISALMQTLYAAMDSVCHAAAEERHSDGMMAVIAYKERNNRKEAETLFHGILCGLELIAEEYADCVKMERLTGERIPDCGRGQ
mgnify:FL=1